MNPSAINEVAGSRCSDQDVSRQLKLILSHDLFSNSPVLSNFLKYIVNETLEGNLTSLKEYTIGVNGLGKKADFNPQIDAIVRIHAGRLRRLLAEYYKAAGRQDRVLIEVTKGSYVPVFSMRYPRQEMPETLALSLDEIKHVKILKATLAILPFRNLSPGNDYQFLADSLGEEFTRVFSGADEFYVIGHQSTIRFSQQHANLHSIGERLNTQYIITGTVMRTDSYFRIVVSLVETHMSTQIWSKAFDYPSDTDAIQAQEQTIDIVYNLLGGPFGCIVRHKARTAKAMSDTALEFDQAQLYYQFHIHFSFFNYAWARRVLEVVLEGDLQYSKALATLAELYLWGRIMGYPTADDPVGTSLQLAHKAMNVDQQCNHARFAFFWASLYNKPKVITEAELNELLKHHSTHVNDTGKIGVALLCAGYYDFARPLLERAVTQGPYYPWSFDLALCVIHYHDKRYTEALASIDRVEASDIYLVDLLKTVLYSKTGMASECRQFRDALQENFPFAAANLKTYLGNFLLDTKLVESLCQEAHKAGVC